MDVGAMQRLKRWNRGKCGSYKRSETFKYKIILLIRYTYQEEPSWKNLKLRV